MAIRFRGVTCTPLIDLNCSAPDRAVIGLIGLNGSGQSELLRLAAGLEAPASGSIEASPRRRLIAAGGPVDLSPVDVLSIDGALTGEDALTREQTVVGLERLRRLGATVLIASHEEALLARMCDEVWWLDGGRLAAHGDPREVLRKYRELVATRLAEWGRSRAEPVDFSTRRGDFRAEIVAIETGPENGGPSLVLKAHEPARIRVRVRFKDAVEHPVIGVMVRTRVGMDVYGTNTDLERVSVGPCAAGDELQLEFRFCCALCPGEYTITAASHDPDGTPHDWLDDAVAFSVAADRYTAGVADLRASVSVERWQPPAETPARAATTSPRPTPAEVTAR